MTRADDVRNAYFDWIVSFVSDGYSNEISYRKLLSTLHGTRFRYSVTNDCNRYEDGLGLRYRFARKNPEFANAEHYLHGPCSVLEMILALAIRCEESIMDDPLKGDRTNQWFWNMITSLGLGAMNDDVFDRDYVKQVIKRFLDRDYAPNGKGGLFTVRGTNRDLRDVEIWSQMCWYLDGIV